MHSIKKFSSWCNTVEASLLLLLVLFVLRIPNLAEPYWYGDEAIYLTIGNALRHGVKLYSEIVDHKTPLIYYLAAVPSQFWFRLLTLAWMSVSTLLFSGVARAVFRAKKPAFFSALLFVLLTSWPGLEGNIPNGELFVMGFILAALWILTKTATFRAWRKGLPLTSVAFDKKEMLFLLAAGVSAGLGALTKVPAILDIGALGLLLVLAALPIKQEKLQNQFLSVLKAGGFFALGVAVPVLISLAYYFFRGSLPAYLEFGLLYNFHYVGTWVPEFPNTTIAFFFSLPGKALLLASGLLLTVLLSWRAKTAKARLLIWSSFWLLATLFASLLSNRPYPHYFLQLVPPVALFSVTLWTARKEYLSLLFGGAVVVLIVASAYFLDFGFYPTIPYYQRYLALLTGRITQAEYAGQFNRLVDQNLQVGQEIVNNTMPEDRIFIWGTNPMLYALTQRVPASRFTVAFHIQDLKVYDQTLLEIQRYEPAYIVVMRNEESWPEFEEYLFENYVQTTTTRDMIVYRRSRITSLLLE